MRRTGVARTRTAWHAGDDRKLRRTLASVSRMDGRPRGGERVEFGLVVFPTRQSIRSHRLAALLED
jgi:hypothetical protein